MGHFIAFVILMLVASTAICFALYFSSRVEQLEQELERKQMRMAQLEQFIKTVQPKTRQI
jgi:hypothetical protein